MANSLNVQISQDGRRNATVKITGVLDTNDIVQTPVISLSQFTNNEPNMTFNGLRLVEADYAVTQGIVVLLGWNGNPEQSIAVFSQAGELQLRRHGGFVPDRTVNGYDGNINLTTRGYLGGNIYGFTLALRMTKMYS